MAEIKPYLTFNGNCEAAFMFYKSVFKTEFSFIGKFKDMPSMGVPELSEIDGEKIMHVTLPIGKNSELMGSDTSSQQNHVIMGSNSAISLNAESKEEADQLFIGLSADGTITMPMENTFWDAYFGMFTDKFGIHWMVNFDTVPQQ